MRRPWWLVLVLGLLSLAFAVPDGDELERNRRLLAKWKADPDHARRLQRDLAAFYSLPPERQEQIRALDRQLHEAEPATQGRLWGVLERYVRWLEKLPEAERRAVLEAQDKGTVIRGLRQREWIERLPRAIREELDRLPPAQRIARIKQLRLQERRQRVLWQRALGGRDGPLLRPAKFDELPADVRAFLLKELLPRLNKNEHLALKQEEGKWPDYPKLIALLADRYPVLPEGPLGRVTSFEKLPDSVQRGLQRAESRGKKGGKGPARFQGRWPEYAVAVSEALRHDRDLVPLGASRPDEFPAPVAAFLRAKLFPALSLTEAAELRRLEGHWPDYPRRLLVLARRHYLTIPGMSLPGPREMWDAARIARQELGPEERESIELIGADPTDGLERLRKAGIKKPQRPWNPKTLRDGR